MAKTKIISTIGPSSESIETMKSLIKAGADIFRLNFSHGSYEWHGEKIDRIKSLDNYPSIILDTKGPEIRTGDIGTPFLIKEGDDIVFTIDKGEYLELGKRVSVNYNAFIDDVAIGTIIVIDSGSAMAVVNKKDNNNIYCTIKSGSCELSSKRHLNLQGRGVSLPTITEQDWKDIAFGVKKKVDFIALSFVRKAEDIKSVRQFCTNLGHCPKIISKIESFEAIGNLAEIVEFSDAIMIARGDLACEINFYDVPSLQRKIASMCIENKTPFIVATQMLASMTRNIRPTRAEVMDVSTAVQEGADAVMLSEETANGKYPVEAVQAMDDIIHSTEVDDFKVSLKEYNYGDVIGEFANIIAEITQHMSGIDGIVVITKLGGKARILSNSCDTLPIYAFTEDEFVKRQINLLRGVIPYVIKFEEDGLEKTIYNIESKIKKEGIILKKYILLSDLYVEGKRSPTIQIRG